MKHDFTRYTILFSGLLSAALALAQGQEPVQFSGIDCNHNDVDLFADLDAGKAVVLHFYMPNCGSCPPPAQKIQAMANKINATHPGMVKGYAFPFQNSTTCIYSSDWVSSNGLGELYAPMDSGAYQVAYYGGFGMPTVVLLGGAAPHRRVMFSTLTFTASDTTIMRDSILALLDGPAGILEHQGAMPSLDVWPNPATAQITVHCTPGQASAVRLEVTDITGKAVLIRDTGGHPGTFTEELDTSTWPGGWYLVRVTAEGRTATQRLCIIPSTSE